MNCKNIFSKTLLGAALVMALQSCGDKNDPAAQVKDKDLPKAEAEQKTGLTAYVEIDSIMTRYEFCKEMSEELLKKSKNYEAQITGKGQALQNAAMNFQQKIQQGTITQEEAQKEQTSLQRQEENLRKLQENLAVKFEQEQAEFNKALRDSVHNFLKAYNKDGRYALILSKSGDNILYADKAMDITEEVIAGLNKRYTKKPAADKKK